MLKAKAQWHLEHNVLKKKKREEKKKKKAGRGRERKKEKANICFGLKLRPSTPSDEL